VSRAVAKARSVLWWLLVKQMQGHCQDGLRMKWFHTRKVATVGVLVWVLGEQLHFLYQVLHTYSHKGCSTKGLSSIILCGIDSRASSIIE